MAINNINGGGAKSPIDNQKLAQQQNLNNNATQAESQKAAASTVRQDSVSLTQSAQQLSQVQRKGTEAPVNQEKVDKLKKAIQRVSTILILKHWQERLLPLKQKYLEARRNSSIMVETRLLRRVK